MTGLLALLLVDARRAARTTAEGELVLLDEQDRTRWDRDRIEEGRRLVVPALTGSAPVGGPGTAPAPRGGPGPYALQAAIAAVHDEAADVATTDWPPAAVAYRRALDLVGNQPERAFLRRRLAEVTQRDVPPADHDGPDRARD